jgi:hypothetical protein
MFRFGGGLFILIFLTGGLATWNLFHGTTFIDNTNYRLEHRSAVIPLNAINGQGTLRVGAQFGSNWTYYPVDGYFGNFHADNGFRIESSTISPWPTLNRIDAERWLITSSGEGTVVISAHYNGQTYFNNETFTFTRQTGGGNDGDDRDIGPPILGSGVNWVSIGSYRDRGIGDVEANASGFGPPVRLSVPVATAVNNPYGAQYIAPDGIRRHTGIDIDRLYVIRTNNEILIHAIGDGTIMDVRMDVRRNSNNADGYGNTVTINHGNGVFSFYAHLDIDSIQRVFGATNRDAIIGSSIRRGDPIGIMGTTGLSGGIHLHLETQRWINNAWVRRNPMNFLFGV